MIDLALTPERQMLLLTDVQRLIRAAEQRAALAMRQAAAKLAADRQAHGMAALIRALPLDARHITQEARHD